MVRKLVMQKKTITRIESKMENVTRLFNTTQMRDEKKSVKKIKMVEKTVMKPVLIIDKKDV
jgi:hypothetical protein